MNEFAFYIVGLLGMISAACALWLSIELKRKEKELKEARKLLDMPIPEPKIETHRYATLHVWQVVDAEMVEILKPEELDRYLRDHLAHKIADEGIKSRLKIEKKRATPFGIQYETKLSIIEDDLLPIPRGDENENY